MWYQNRTILVAIGLAGLGLLPGCAGSPGPIRERMTQQGTLRAMVSQLQFENEKLRRETAELRTENVRVADQLEREESLNSDLTARVENLRGFGAKEPGPAFASEEPSGPTTVPAGRATTPSRKAPFARIPGRNEPAPFLDARPTAPDDDRPAPRPKSLDFGPESRRDDPNDGRWLPIVRDPRPGRTVR